MVLLKHYDRPKVINVGVRQETSIAWLARKLKCISGLWGDLVFDKNRPDGNPRRLLDSRKMSSIRFQQLSCGKHFPEQSPVKGAGKD